MPATLLRVPTACRRAARIGSPAGSARQSPPRATIPAPIEPNKNSRRSIMHPLLLPFVHRDLYTVVGSQMFRESAGSGSISCRYRVALSPPPNIERLAKLILAPLVDITC